MHVNAGVGITNGLPGVELGVGYRHSQGAYSLGFTAPKDDAMPLLLHARGTLLMQSGFTMGAGPVWIIYNADDTRRNKLAAQVAAAYHFCFYKRTSFYISATYTTPAFVSAHVGMSYGLWR